MQETSTKPYLLRALHEWCTDNGYTPHIVVKVDENTAVPAAHVHEGQITLNIGTLATNRLSLVNDYIEFQARFSGVTENIFVPVAAVSAIYARETGSGMGFEVEESKPYSDDGTEVSVIDTTPAASSSDPDDEPTPPRKPHLTVVK